MNLSLAKFAVPCLIAALIAVPAFAAKKDKGSKDATAALQKKLQKADLPGDVQEKTKKVMVEFGPKVREAQTAVDASLTSEQKSAKAAAEKAAKDEGKKRKDAQADVAAAMKLTPEQKEKYAAAQRKLDSAQADLDSALRDVLSAEQQEKVGLKAKKKKKNA
jgi:hypothetical protein